MLALNPQAYLWLNTARLDSQPDVVRSGEPDRAHGAGQKGKSKKGPTVTIRDVLDHKQGEEVWVVINGDVYKWVITSAFLISMLCSTILSWLLSCFLLFASRV